MKYLLMSLCLVASAANAAYFPLVVEAQRPQFRAIPSDSTLPSDMNVVGIFPHPTDPSLAVLEVEACNKYFKFEFKVAALKTESGRGQLADEVLDAVAKECAKR